MPSRQYRDPSGTEWEVFEVHRLDDRPNSVRPALAAGWLAFHSGSEKRRLPRFPADWLDVPDDELQELLTAAVVVADATSSREARRARPRITPRSRPPLPATDAAEPTSATTAVNGYPDTAAVLPVPEPLTVTGTLSEAGIEALVRAHARQARREGVAVIRGMIGVKRALANAGADISPETIRLLRKVFVDEFYFSR